MISDMIFNNKLWCDVCITQETQEGVLFVEQTSNEQKCASQYLRVWNIWIWGGEKVIWDNRSSSIYTIKPCLDLRIVLFSSQTLSMWTWHFTLYIRCTQKISGATSTSCDIDFPMRRKELFKNCFQLVFWNTSFSYQIKWYRGMMTYICHLLIRL